METFRGLSSRQAQQFGLAVSAFGKVRLYGYLSLKAVGGVIHDQIEGTPVLIALSQEAGVARAFMATVDDEALHFELVEDTDGELLLRDTDTGNTFDGLSGLCAEGAFEGDAPLPLVSFPILIDRFKAHFRDGQVYEEPSEDKEDRDEVVKKAKKGAGSQGSRKD